MNTENALREEFKQILADLGKNQELLLNSAERSKMYKRLEDLYYRDDSKQFRHFYSDIFIVLTQMLQGDIEGNINILGQNLDELRKGYRALNRDSKGNTIDISDSINKLYDHVNLDISRINYSDKSGRDLLNTDNIANINREFQRIKQRASDIEETNDALEKKIENAQKEYITILGIFATVIITFTGGLTFSSSVLQSMNVAGIYRVLLVSLVIGLVLVNVFYGLFSFVGALVSPKKRLKSTHALLANVLFVILILSVVAAWLFGVVEKRDIAIQDSAIETIAPSTEDDVYGEKLILE